MMQLETSNQHPENIINNLQKIGLYNEQFSQTTPLYIYIYNLYISSIKWLQEHYHSKKRIN